MTILLILTVTLGVLLLLLIHSDNRKAQKLMEIHEKIRRDEREAWERIDREFHEQMSRIDSDFHEQMHLTPEAK